jgi:hypothetical protein
VEGLPSANLKGEVMKKRIIISSVAITLAFLVGLAWAITWHTANKATLVWDPVTTLEDGTTPIPAGSTIKYVTYIANAITDPNKANPVVVPTSAECDGVATQCTVTFNTEGRFFMGVKAERYVNNEKVSESILAWADDPQYAQDGVGFGAQYFLPVSAPGGLRGG